jgi:hypothetical protein
VTDWAAAAAEITRRYRLDKWVYRADELPLAPRLRSQPLPLPMRVEMFWRRENFHPVIQMNLVTIQRLLFSVDVAALKQALAQLVQRHEPLRTELLMVDGSPAQRILGEGTTALEVIDLTALEPVAQKKDEARLMYAFAQQDIDLFSGPTFRARLIQSGPDNYILGLLIHHYFSDAKSLQVILNELLSLYAARVRNQSVGLPVLRWQYVDYALWQRNYAAPRLEEYLGHWEMKLAQAPWLGLSPQGAADRRNTGIIPFSIPGVSARLKQVAHNAKTTMFAACLAAYQLAVAEISGQRAIVTSVPVAARARRDFAETMGYLMNALPIHTHVTPDASVADLLATFGQKLMADYFRQDISYELLEEFLPAAHLDQHVQFYSDGFRATAPGIQYRPD